MSPKEEPKEESEPKRVHKPAESRKSTFMKMTIDTAKPAGYAGRKKTTTTKQEPAS